jgi:VWFA-related protein
MRTLALVMASVMALPGASRAQATEYEVAIENSDKSQKPVVSAMRERGGKQERYVSFQLKIRRAGGREPVTDVPREWIVVKEDGKEVKELEIFQPNNQPLTVILAMDVSGSMASGGKMEQARRAALAFLDRLDPRADTGLVLFDHEMKLKVPPARDPSKLQAHRERLRQEVRNARPQGGTAYLDATAESVKLLRGVGGRKVVIVMTDGMDTNSKATLDEAVNAALAGELSVYTVGIGQPGENKPVTTVLVLDRSGSTLEPADDGDKKTGKRKIDALKEAATRFVELMRKKAKTTLLPFSDKIDTPEPFTDDVELLKDRIDRLKPFGGTMLYDATLAGVETLMAADPPGKRAIIALTDGRDESPGSRHSDNEVIARAKEAGIPLYMLGLGGKEDLNEEVMRKMARETGGEYYHAGSARKLIDVFEALSIDLHDDGIDEDSLQALATRTGGKYSHAKDIDKLSFIYERLADELQSTYKVTFTSRRASHDGTMRGIDVAIYRNNQRISGVASADYGVRGIVVPQVSYWVYLGLLAGLGCLLAMPENIKRIHRMMGGQP